MPSADLRAAIETAVKARVVNNGQSCIAAKRFIVADAVADDFERGFVERMRALKVGDPMDAATEVGPAGDEDRAHDLDDQVRRSVAAGARVLTGGQRARPPGLLLRADGAGRHPAPVARLPRGAVRTGGRAVPRARHRRGDRAGQRHAFGLGSSVWTNDAAERAPVHRRDRGGAGVRQRHGRLRPAPAVRRREALRLRPRAGRLRHPRVRQHQDRLDPRRRDFSAYERRP